MSEYFEGIALINDQDERSEGEEFIRWKIVLEYILFFDETKTTNIQAKIDEDV